MKDLLAWDAEVSGYFVRDFADGTLAIHILPMIYNHRVVVSRRRPDGEIDQLAGVLDAWCYSNMADAVAACASWNPDAEREPTGWIKHPFSGRRHGEPYPS